MGNQLDIKEKITDGLLEKQIDLRVLPLEAKLSGGGWIEDNIRKDRALRKELWEGSK
jgi:hypothetical protein